jgi:ketosteroid isomerase-like protein
VELVRSIVDGWERGDFSSDEWGHPEIEFVIVDGPSPGNWKGVVGMAEAWRDVLSAWDEWPSEHEEYRPLGDGCVLVLWRFRARGKTSGLEASEVRATGAAVFTIRSGKVIRLVHYFDRDHARADLGLIGEVS